MALINALGPKLFPNGYDPLTPQLAKTGVTALEAINLPPGRKDVSVQCIANRIADLLEDGDEIRDKATRQLRPARPSDIAVLCYSHSKCADMAAELEARGLPVRLQQAGWLDGRPMRIARAALLFIADPTDVLAALTWLTLGPPCMSLEDALLNAVDRVVLTHAALDPLRALHKNADILPMAEITARMLSETRLRDWAGSLSEPHQALADLARLQAEAQAFDAQDPDLRAAAGFHGHGLALFLGGIAAQSDPKLDRHPDPDGWSSIGIEISTWHAAKGREWPITVVTELTKNIAERPGSLRADFAHFDDLDEVLDHAGLAFLPEFAAPESQETFAQAQRPVDEQEAARNLYVALTRARDRLILALPPEPKKPRTEITRMVHLLRDRAGLQAANGMIIVDGKEFAARVIEGNPDEPIECEEVSDEPFSRFGNPAPKTHAAQTPWRRRPSSLAPKDSDVPEGFYTQPLASPIKPRQKRAAADLGNAWHLAFRVFASRPDMAGHLADATGVPPETLSEVQENTSRVTSWLKDEGYDKLHFELPLQVTAPDGSQTNAIIDCLAEGPDGFLILDHKSGPCPDPEARFISYLPQLQAYADLITATRPDKPLRGLAINWMSEGTLSLCPVATKETV
jgi:ATP-dependent exoDNAse (exonuclease V) beta subunit